MGKLNKFENVYVTASLEAIMKQNTAFYQSDFDIDKEIIKRAAESPNAGDKMLLWFSRPSGTCCIKERDAFLKDTREHNTWKFYGEQTRDRVLAYAVELTGIQDGKITGNLYELDYQQHYKHVTEQALPADNYMLIYEHGEREQPAARLFDASPNPQLGKFERFEAVPKKCTECGAFFASSSNSVKYCPDCRKRITRRQAAERMRKRRAPVTQ